MFHLRLLQPAHNPEAEQYGDYGQHNKEKRQRTFAYKAVAEAFEELVLKGGVVVMPLADVRVHDLYTVHLVYVHKEVYGAVIPYQQQHRKQLENILYALHHLCYAEQRYKKSEYGTMPRDATIRYFGHARRPIRAAVRG